MRLRKILIIILVGLEMGLLVKIGMNYYDNASIKIKGEQAIELIEDRLADEINNQELKTDKTDKTNIEIPVNVNTVDNKKVSVNVLGKIIIKKINMDYPIIEGATEDNLKISITRFYGSQINSEGNCVLAGHNMNDGSMFGKLKELQQDDNIFLYDNAGNKKEYKIFNIRIVKPDDMTVLLQDTEGTCLITLITCSNNGKNRLIIQAKGI